ncbi:DegT/DnrJ/EryC1/StrS family aminotransferase [Phytomonospora endophytica]|uniref:dTDP-4-amino-4,6-dideoxygalactose transaminase n=1 Tax=Phytomonospora endophytica TaxID=714109 RepID=A0A841FT62_9ACTN|nr:DegT/DnrJ/EryC1/StrS family aminotransferase [Phytomonospora endophytica]MBB6035719.1 dTDP-4-amino-4,6-dideoxygalactose transaminase [Phytomonospora endophytica]GIG69604.1 pyridoxal phosphate-dependent aminotransferase [Phytomonospora endophytica]
MAEVIALGQPTVGEEELAAVREVFASGWLAGNGPTCRKFEERFAAVVGTSHALALNSCGGGLHLAMDAFDVKPGDEVIVADYTFPATGHSVMWAGATPVFADVRADTATIDPAAVAAAVTDKTVGVIAVDPFGLPADYAELREITGRHGLFLVQDAACAAGATYQGAPAGGQGDVAVFSFHGRKGITAGEGGAFVTDRPELDAQARKMHSYGIEGAVTRAALSKLPMPEFDEAGYNYRMSDVAAAMMIVQLDRLPSILAARTKVADSYAELLGDCELLTLPSVPADRTHPWQSYVVTLARGIDRGEVAMRLRDRGVQCTFGTYASHLQPVYGATAPCPVSADLFARHLAIPMHANLTESQVETVAATLREVLSAVATNP